MGSGPQSRRSNGGPLGAATRRQHQHAVGRRKAPRCVVRRAHVRARRPPAGTCLLHGARGPDYDTTCILPRTPSPPQDEPTNHLDAHSVGWLENFLSEFPGAVVTVTHDRALLESLTGWIVDLEYGGVSVYKGNYSAWLDQKQAEQISLPGARFRSRPSSC